MCSLLFASCSTTDIKAFNSLETNFKSRGCGSKGHLQIVGGTVTSLPRIDGNYDWDCPQVIPVPAK